MKIAVIGGGISGIGSAWLLSRHYDVQLFEADTRLGGHAHTVTVDEGVDGQVALDTGFLVYNTLTYPLLTNFFKLLDVETVDSDMSLSVQVPSKNLEWSGTSISSIFGQRKNVLRPSFYKMLFEITRFGKEADENLASARRHGWSLSDLLKARRFSEAFCTDYLVPIGAAIWSTPETKMLQFPAETFLAFFINHKLLQVNNRPIWRTVKNGSISYVSKAAKKIGQVHLGTPVISVRRQKGKVLVTVRHATGGQSVTEFDRVVMATHAPITAKILSFENDREREVLSTIQYESNRTVLHRDPRVMPRNKICWSSWNVRGTNDLSKQHEVALSYYINRLQPLKTKRDYFVTLNESKPLENTIRQFDYAHPQFDQRAIRAQRDLPSIQGGGGVYFAGAWSRYGFHEDGLLSAVKVAELMGVSNPLAQV